jgi:UDPglucose 6-dehydrogenase/GDP-mannose 6-dehydrogenase
MNITVVGTGYVGLVSGVCLAAVGHNITCVDVREEVVDNLNNRIPHIYENGLAELLDEVIEYDNFRATTDLYKALDNSNVVIVAVGTPSENGKIDLSQIKTVCTQIGEYIKTTEKFISVIIKSTVIPTTTDTFVKNIIEKSSGKKLGQFGLGMNPEFLKEGDAINDFMKPDRVVIGFEDETTKQILEEIYSPWGCLKICVNTRTAEMIKYTNNTLLACIISINNELANIATEIGDIDYNNVIDGVISDKRWSPTIDGKIITPTITSYFTPGAGFGGSCFPKDVQAIRTQGEKLGLQMSVTNAVLKINDKQPRQVINSLVRKFDSLYDKKALLLGLSFKPGTDDIRESSALKILDLLLQEEIKVIAHDPLAIEHTKKIYKDSNLSFTQTWISEIPSVDLIIIGTNWPEYKELKNHLSILKEQNIVLFDTKRLFKVDEMNDIEYLTFGYFKNNG